MPDRLADLTKPTDNRPVPIKEIQRLHKAGYTKIKESGRYAHPDGTSAELRFNEKLQQWEIHLHGALRQFGL